tara:strand:- start:299 stop:454 length:156 start_codon:yes stop_codon:yes gene_type:complete
MRESIKYILVGRYCLNTEPKEQRPGNSQANGPQKNNSGKELSSTEGVKTLR